MIIKALDSLKEAEFLAGVTLLVDKPLEWTSFDVVNKIRFVLKKKLDIKKIKVGHAGTLDPLATGLLIISIGKDTKKIDEYQALYKSYSGTMTLGASTKSYDAEFEPDNFYPTEHIDATLIEKERLNFVGVIEQYPPAFSALKVGGKRAYKLAREGIVPELKPRMVEIHAFEIEANDFPDLKFYVKCQKGTYIRSLAHDYGKALASGAFLKNLRREAIGEYSVEDAFTVDELVEVLSEA